MHRLPLPELRNTKETMQDTVISRRGMLKSAACGFGSLAIAGMQGARALSDNPLAPQTPLIPQRAKRVIFACMRGGPSHVDTFDHKPKLLQDEGKTAGFGTRKLLGSPFKFKKHGKSGLPISELFPHLAKHADKQLQV